MWSEIWSYPTNVEVTNPYIINPATVLFTGSTLLSVVLFEAKTTRATFIVPHMSLSGSVDKVSPCREDPRLSQETTGAPSMVSWWLGHFYWRSGLSCRLLTYGICAWNVCIRTDKIKWTVGSNILRYRLGHPV